MGARPSSAARRSPVRMDDRMSVGPVRMKILHQDLHNPDAEGHIYGHEIRLGTEGRIASGTFYDPPISVGHRSIVNQAVTIGRFTAISEDTIIRKTSLGSFCSIGRYCSLNHMGRHPTGWLSTNKFRAPDSPFKFFRGLADLQSLPTAPTYGMLEIGHDVWIGDDVYIVGDIKIGHGAIIGAKSFVNRDIPPYAIAAGAPARVKKFRFPEATIAKLLDLCWWDLRLADLAEVQFDQIDVAIEQIRAIQHRQSRSTTDEK